MPPPWTWYLLLLCIHIDAFVRAGTATADDTDAGMYYSGLWVPDGDPNTFGHHDTWTNQSGASVVFDFIGTQIQVFATRRPTGTYLSNVSFSVDGGPSMLWTTSEFVPEITYKNLVYTSPSLPPAQHRITITNIGAIFWLDYVQWITADAPPNTGNGEGGGTTTTTKVLSPSSSPSRTPPTTTSTRASPTSSETSSAAPSTATSPSSGIPAETSSAGPDPTAPPDASASAPISPPQSSASTETGSPSGLAAATRDSSESSSRTPMIVGMAVAGVGALALLLAVFWWLRMRARARGQSGTQTAQQPTKRERGASSVTPFEMYPAPAPSDGSSKSKQALSSTLPQSSGPRAAFFAGSDTPSTYGDPRGMDTEPPTFYSLSEKAALAHRYDSGSHTESSTSTTAPRPLPPAPTTRTSSAVSPSSPSTPSSRIPLGRSPAHSAPTSAIASPLSASASGTDSFSSSFSPTSPTLRPPGFRSVRHSQDAGIRLAGGPVDEAEAHRWTLTRYDDDTYEEVETLPPSYAQLHGSGRS